MKITKPEHPHEKHYKLAWKHTREGILLCRQNSENMERVIRFAEARNDQAWVKLLKGQIPEHFKYLDDIENFENLPDKEKDFWYSILQNHPFVAILAPLRYEELKKRRKYREP